LRARSVIPVIIKAVAGGGGRGMRIAHNDVSFAKEYHVARNEAEKAFGNGAVYIEKYIEKPRHIEFQILADGHGKILHLGERDCSVQRRHQKLIEESPPRFLTPGLRKAMGKAASRRRAAADYENAGTIEFLVDAKGNFYFIEMNTRIQVEHPVTEECTGIDLIKQQIRVANGEKLDFDQGDITFNKHAIECRINAEDPARNFHPVPRYDRPVLRPGRPRRARRQPCLQRLLDPALLRLHDRQADHVRSGSQNRLERMYRALSEYLIRGIKTTIPLHKAIMSDPVFIEGKATTAYMEEFMARTPTDLFT
jgi:acetyl-CoA carboxylase biotin carboxylase subunit